MRLGKGARASFGGEFGDLTGDTRKDRCGNESAIVLLWGQISLIHHDHRDISRFLDWEETGKARDVFVRVVTAARSN